MQNKIILIAAIGKNRELGEGNDLVWRISDDLKRFRSETKGNAVIMGRKTYESIGRPLPKRVNIIVTRNTEYHQEGCVVVNSLEQAIETAKNSGVEKVFVIGGGEIYTLALPYADILDLTLVDAENPNADVFFPEFENEFEKVSEEESREEDGLRYQWVQFKKKNG